MPLLTKRDYSQLYKHDEYKPVGCCGSICHITAIVLICIVIFIISCLSGCTTVDKYPKKYTKNGATYHRFLKTHYYWTIDNDSTKTLGTDWNYSPR